VNGREKKVVKRAVWDEQEEVIERGGFEEKLEWLKQFGGVRFGLSGTGTDKKGQMARKRYLPE